MVQRIVRNRSCVEVFWGRDPHATLEADRTPEKVRKGLEDQLRTNGRPAWLWLPVLGSSVGTVPCTCDKDTTQSSDFKCLSCYGARFAPGFRKFLHETVFWASAEANGYAGPYPPVQAPFALTNITVDRTKKPNRLMIASGATTGMIVTVDKPYANPGNDSWTVYLAAFKKTAGDTLALEYSTDLGTTYRSVALVSGLFGYQGTLTGFGSPVGSGLLRFRVTLTRTSTTTEESPSFEIVRAVHVRSADVNPILAQRQDLSVGQILLLKTWDQEFVAREIARGRTVEAMGDRAWTAPLDFFDTTLMRDTPAVAFDDREAGPHPLFEYSEGVRANQRYAIYAINLDATLNNVMSHQSFSERRIQPGETYAYVP